MTPAARARAIVAYAQQDGRDMEAYVQAHIEAAVMAERAACIECAWDHSCKSYHELCDCRAHIITNIRARP